MNVVTRKDPRAEGPGPCIGYNHNFRRNGRVFHIQTEDSGSRNPHIYTHVFCAGAVVASKRTDYDPSEKRSGREILSLMRMSHRDMYAALAKGALDDKIDAVCGGRRVFQVAPEPDVEVRELDPDTTLEILSRLESGLDGFLGAAIIDQDARTAVHSISVSNDLSAVAEPSSELLAAIHRTLEGLQLGTGVEDILTTTQDRLLILRPVSRRFFVYVLTNRTQTNLAMARHLVASAANAIRDDE